MSQKIQLLDVVALAQPLQEKGLLRGQVGTVVEALTEEMVEVEFSDEEGRPYAFAAVPIEKLIVLHYRPEVERA